MAVGGGIGTFTGSITGLQAGLPYYVRAYVTNSVGTAYGIATSVNSLTADINNLISQAYIDELKRFGMPINGGVTPPNAMSIFNVTPNALKGTNILNDWSIGSLFWDERIKFSIQDNSKLTVKLNYIPGTTEYSSIGSFIVGSGNDFTIFCKTMSKGSLMLFHFAIKLQIIIKYIPAFKLDYIMSKLGYQHLFLLTFINMFLTLHHTKT